LFIISVAATTNNDTKASFSNWGAVTVDLGAPGQTVLSTWPTNNYAYLDGTSMACPHVTGVVALVYAKNPGWTYQQVRTQIFNTVRKINALNGITVTGGVVNLQNAIGVANPPDAPTNLTQWWLSITTVQLRWTDNANNETGFELQKEEFVGGQWTNQQSLGTTGPDVTQFNYAAGPPGLLIRVRIRAFNDAGQSAWTNWLLLLH
jgi:subtilisin family serine protease